MAKHVTARKKKRGRPVGSGPKSIYTRRADVPLTPQERLRFVRAAKAVDMPLAAWLRLCANAVCDAQDGKPDPRGES